MRIIIARHGKVQSQTKQWVNSRYYGNWIKQYDNADLDQTSKPSKELCILSQNASLIVTSSLKRSIASATLLNPKASLHSVDYFKEVAMPYLHIPGVKLPIGLWSIIYRAMQVIGLSKHAEPWEMAHQRAKRCTDELLTLSKEYESIVFIGHGVFNHLLTKQLLRQGFVNVAQYQANKHWGWKEFTSTK